MIIYNTTELNSGIGVYAYNLSKGLNINLLNDFLNNQHYYVDYFKKNLLRKKINEIVINSSIFSNHYLGSKNIYVIHDFFYKDYSKYMSKFSKFIFDYASFQARINANKFICVSNYTYNRALKELNKDRLEFIYPFVNPKFDYKGSKTRSSLIILMDSSNFINKRHEYYQRFYNYVTENYFKDFRFIRFNKIGYPIYISFYDIWSKNYRNISEDLLIEIYRQSNVFVSFSENEGFGYPLVQAVLSQNSVVVAENETYKELLGSDFRYFIKDVNDFKGIFEMILQSLDDIEMRKSIYNRVSMLIDPIGLKKQWEYVSMN